jgi:hypothetical protein
MGLIFLTASKKGNKVCSPKADVVALEGPWVQFLGVNSAGKSRIREVKPDGNIVTFEVYETANAIEAWKNYANATAIVAKNHIVVAAAALGATAGAAYDVIKYLTEVASGTAGSADGVQLSAATVGAVRVVINSNSFALDIWPQTGENINGAADDALYAQPAFSRRHYICDVAGEWKVANDETF